MNKLYSAVQFSFITNDGNADNWHDCICNEEYFTSEDKEKAEKVYKDIDCKLIYQESFLMTVFKHFCKMLIVEYFDEESGNYQGKEILDFDVPCKNDLDKFLKK